MRTSGDVESPSDPARFRHLVEHIQDAVVEFEFVDGEPIVLSTNPAFVEVFGYDTEEIVGKSLNDAVVPPWLSDEAEGLDSRTTAGKVNYSHVRRETADGLREFLYRGIPYELDDGRICGFAVYTDLTEDHRNRNRVEVTNRILRHNLRNNVNVIRGASERVAETLAADTEAAETVAMLVNAVERLSKLTTEATEIHRTLDEPFTETPRIDCVPLLDRVVEEFRASHPAADIRTALPERLDVAATERLEVAVASLVENAVEHNPADRPRVWVRARPIGTGTWAAVTVADDGPRIPEAERDILTGKADITPVRHGSGLGLWLVKWTVDRFGGDLSFGESEAGGNRVRLRLPRPADAPP
jgi:PAS domain S-box-containing protein